MLSLESLGFCSYYAVQLDTLADPRLRPARVCAHHRGRYGLLLGGPEPAGASGFTSGRFRLERDPLELPAVGDWVAVEGTGGRDPLVIRHRLERRTALVRRAAGQRTVAQVLAANVDTVFVVTSPNQDFSLRRVERYLAVIAESGAQPVLVLNKADLADDSGPFLDRLAEVAPAVPRLATWALAPNGAAALEPHLTPGNTVVFVGSSGVGKSTLVNALLGTRARETSGIRSHDDQGRHTTSGRELLVLPGGAILIDTPGLRELQLWTSAEALEATFDELTTLAGACRFRNCHHAGDVGCAIEAAVAEGRISAERLESWRKLGREQVRLEELRSGSREADRRFARKVREVMRAKRERRGG